MIQAIVTLTLEYESEDLDKDEVESSLSRVDMGPMVASFLSPGALVVDSWSHDILVKDKEITQEEFDMALSKMVGEASAEQLLAVPGLYEVLSEAWNNEVIKKAGG